MATFSSKIEAELRKALGDKFAVKEDEAGHKYRARLVRGINELPDNAWEGMSKETQAWLNDGVKAVQEKTEVPDFPDVEKAKTESKREKLEDKPAKGEKAKEKASDGDSDGDDDEDEDDEEDEKPSKKSKSKDEDDEEDEKPSKSSKKDKKAEKADKPKKEKKDRKPSVVGKFRDLMIKHPKWGSDKIVEKLKEDGFEVADYTARTIFYNGRGMLKALAKADALKDPSIAGEESED